MTSTTNLKLLNVGVTQGNVVHAVALDLTLKDFMHAVPRSAYVSVAVKKVVLVCQVGAAYLGGGQLTAGTTSNDSQFQTIMVKVLPTPLASTDQGISASNIIGGSGTNTRLMQLDVSNVAGDQNKVQQARMWPWCNKTQAQQWSKHAVPFTNVAVGQEDQCIWKCFHMILSQADGANFYAANSDGGAPTIYNLSYYFMVDIVATRAS
jgi:hypothetical protein